MRAVILATERDRIFNREEPKALIKLCGSSLLERNLRALRAIGIRDVIIVTGYNGGLITERLGDGQNLALSIEYVVSPVKYLQFNRASPEYQQGNAGSILKLRDSVNPVRYDESNGVNGDFLLVPGDGVFDRRILEELVKREGMVFCYDSDLKHPNVNKSPKILVENGKVKGIGMDLRRWNGVYIGLSMSDPKIFTILEHSIDLVECLNEMAGRYEVCGLDVSEIPSYVAGMRREVKPFWFRIDSKEELKLCKKQLVESTQKGTLDFHAWYINRHIENKIIYHISELSITPNQMTVLTNLVAYLATFLFLTGHLLAGSILTFVVSVMDGLDGKLARIKGILTKLGNIEHSFDFLFEQSWYVGLAWFLSSSTGSWLPLKLAVGIVLFNGFATHCYMQFKEVMKVSLSDYASFDRRFRRIDGRKNIYIYYILVGVLLGVPLYSLVGILAHSMLTAVVYAFRACKHLREADRR